MKDFKTIEIDIKNEVATVWLNRPGIHNAFNETMISELIRTYAILEGNSEVRVIVLRGRGKSFCSGSDLNWMKSVIGYNYEENYNESRNLSTCFHTIYSCSKVTISLVHGVALAGANGLLAACDFSIADENASFSLSEVKVGVIPSCIAPFILKRVGEFKTKELMLTGNRFSADKAKDYGLINFVYPPNIIEEELDKLIKHILTGGPNAISRCKELIYQITNNMDYTEVLDYTARMITQIRASDEGQEGMAAFLEKRSPNWIKE